MTDYVEATDPNASPPGTINELQSRMTEQARLRGTTRARLSGLVVNIVIGQMLPESAVKGGTGLKLRYGDRFTRETPDLDTSFRAGTPEDFVAELDQNLRRGWGPFTGEAVAGRRRVPRGLPAEYAMLPTTVQLYYRGRPLTRTVVEIGYDELEATTDDTAELVSSEEARHVFASLGLPTPAPIRVLAIHHQMGQKIHACSEPGSDRAHDLVDLQIMERDADPAAVADVAKRLFRFRRSHQWPPTLEYQEAWEIAYATAAEGLDVREYPDAVTWFNAYVEGLHRL